MRVVGYTENGASATLNQAGLIEATSLDQLRTFLKPPRLVVVYIPAGPALDTMLASLSTVLEQGDIIVDR
jgi:6-phosphogluconate dehydrogenase